jgi:hypothetical protein
MRKRNGGEAWELRRRQQACEPGTWAAECHSRPAAGWGRGGGCLGLGRAASLLLVLRPLASAAWVLLIRSFFGRARSISAGAGMAHGLHTTLLIRFLPAACS